MTYVIPTGIDREIAKSIVKQCSTLQLDKAEINLADSGVQYEDEKKRLSHIAWLPTDCWIAGMMAHFVNEANYNNFKYDLTQWAAHIQYTEYRGAKSTYQWHNDHAPSAFDQSMIRKLSISMFLSDPEEYEGGEFEIIDLVTNNKHSIKPPMGTVIIFPSLARHRIKPLKSGKRISLVGWMAGPPFR